MCGGAANVEMRIVTFIAAATVLSSHYSFRGYPVSVTDHAKRQRGRTSGCRSRGSGDGVETKSQAWRRR